MLFSKLIKELKKGEAGLVDYEILNDPDVSVAASIDKVTSNQISFLDKESPLTLRKCIKNTQASILLIPSNDIEIIEIARESSFAWASLKEPKLGFAETLNILYPPELEPEGIHKTAIIAENVKVGSGVTIGPNVFIGDDSEIGDGTIIHAGVVIYKKVKIGNKNVIHANSVIHSGSLLRDECVINSNAVIGGEGFGFVPTPKGWKKMPQIGHVILENKVEIGSCTTIDRPSVGVTVIGKDTKIDNLVQIGHGASIGKGCAMAAQVGLAGGVQIGNSVILAGQVGVTNKVKVGDGVIASSKCGIHTDIEPGTVVSGFPAISNKLWLRCSATFKKLPELVKAIRELERKSSR